MTELDAKIRLVMADLQIAAAKNDVPAVLALSERLRTLLGMTSTRP